MPGEGEVRRSMPEIEAVSMGSERMATIDIVDPVTTTISLKDG